MMTNNMNAHLERELIEVEVEVARERLRKAKAEADYAELILGETEKERRSGYLIGRVPRPMGGS